MGTGNPRRHQSGRDVPRTVQRRTRHRHSPSCQRRRQSRTTASGKTTRARDSGGRAAALLHSPSQRPHNRASFCVTFTCKITVFCGNRITELHIPLHASFSRKQEYLYWDSLKKCSIYETQCHETTVHSCLLIFLLKEMPNTYLNKNPSASKHLRSQLRLPALDRKQSVNGPLPPFDRNTSKNEPLQRPLCVAIVQTKTNHLNNIIFKG